MGTVEGADVRLSNSSFTLAGISKVSTCERSKPAASLIGHLKRKPSEVVNNMSQSCQKLISKNSLVGNDKARSTQNS